MPTDDRRFRIVPMFSNGPDFLPLRMQGEFDYATAYRLVCDWNCAHSAVHAVVIWETAIEEI